MSISKVRTVLYAAGKILGDVSAVKNGTIHKRIARRAIGKVSSRLISKIIK